MTNLNDKNSKKILPNQNRYLPIILWLFPLFLLNIGWYFFNFIDNRWITNEWIEKSKQEVELLAESSDLPYCIGKIYGSFFDELKSRVDSFDGLNNKGILLNHLTNLAIQKFRKPFPEHNLYLFRISTENNKSELIYSNIEKIMSKRALGRAFEYFVRINSFDNTYSDNDKQKDSTFAKNILGFECNPSIVAKTQRGKVSYSLFNLKPHYFLWDYYKNEKTGDIYGLFLLIENNVNSEIASKLIALRELNNYGNNDGKKRIGAFIPLFPGFGGVIANEEFSKMPEFKKVIRQWTPKNIDDLYDWQFKDISKLFENARVGNYQAFFHISSGQSHSAVLLKPILDKAKTPFWLYLLNIFFISIIILLLIRGFLFGIWPNTTLKIRFITTFFLAACMPLGLLIIASYGYISEFTHTAQFGNLSQLRQCINQFDSRKTQNQEEYKTAFSEIVNDIEFQDRIKRYNEANIKKPSEFPEKAKEVLNRALEIINKDSRYLPILSFTIIDECGNSFSNYGNRNCQFFKILEGQEFSSDSDFTKEEIISKDINDKGINVLMYSFIQTIRNKILSTASDTKKWDGELTPNLFQETAMGGFKNAAGGSADLTKMLDEHRSISIDRLVGDRIISHIYDNIYIDGIPRFVVYFSWDVAGLDEKSFKSSLEHFSLHEPNFVFSAFKSTSLGVKPWIDSGRHGREFEKISESLANQANLRGNSISYQDDKMSVIAVPSKKYENTIIVGGVSHYNLKMPVFNRTIIFCTIIAISLVIFIYCIYFSFKIFLKPISNLKNVLDRVADGHLDIEIKSCSRDEFGFMSHEFGAMTRELSERNKLATLLSDHAVEALSKNEYAVGIDSGVETFKGTALVTDIRNFTGMCENYEPEQITDLLNEHFACMTRIFTANNGRIYKYIGDAIEVVFSDNDDLENKSFERAFFSAVEMLEALKEINQKRKDKNLFEYKIGVGLCYSTMSSGSIGSLETRLDYAILGDALKNAAKLESFSKLNPGFPLIVDENFITYFKNKFDNINFVFINSEDSVAGYKIDDSCLSLVHEINNRKKANVANDAAYFDKISSNNPVENNKSLVESYDIDEKISFRTKFISGFIIILLFVLILAFGLYYTNKSKNDSKIVEISSINQHILEQISGDFYGKIAFDLKCRQFTQTLQEKINKLQVNEITDEIIKDIINKCYDNDLSVKELNLNSAFVRIGDFNKKEKKEENIDFYFEKIIPVYPVVNIGYYDKELKQICDTYKLIHLHWSNFDNDKIDDFIKNYGEPCKKVFGEKIILSQFRGDGKNTSIDAIMRGEDAYLYTLDFYKEFYDSKDKQAKKLIGYLVMSVPAKNTYKSVPFILSSFSKNGEHIILNKKNTKECFFSNNIPLYVKNRINKIALENKKSNSLADIKEYLNSVGRILIQNNIKIDDNSYEIFFIGLLGKNNILSTLDYVIICLFALLLIWVLNGLIKGISIFNKSIPAKLWLALLIVAVIPVLTLFFVPSLYLNEYLSAKKSLMRGEMQRFMGIYERKMDFSLPLIWNDLEKKNHSADLNNYIKNLNNSKLSKDVRKESMNQLRSDLDFWLDREKRYSSIAKIKKKEKAIICYKFTDVTISGKSGWSFCYSDDKKDDSIEDKPISLDSFDEKGQATKKKDNMFGKILKLISKSLLERKQSDTSLEPINTKNVANELAFETSLDTIKTFYGEDTFIKISHGINVITVFDIGFGKFGVMIGAIPDYKNPEAIIVWMINFDNFYYMERNTDKIESNFKIFTSENFRYGIVAKETDDNNIRILIGEYASGIAASNLPLSSNIELYDENFLVEGGPGQTQLNSLLVVLAPEKELKNEVDNLASVFYILLAVSLIIIIITTKNIADDIINPVNALILGVKEVNRENFSFRINSDRTDELGALCFSFDRMIKGLDEKRMMSRMLSKTARMVTLKEGTVTSGKTDAVFLYLGVPDFSKIMKKLGDYEVFRLLKQQTSVVAGIIMDEGGEVDKIIGEKILAVFRVNKNEHETALSAFRVAKKILELEKTNQLSFSISIGLNYGKVINGFLGVGSKRDFTVIGDPVNVTARIESLAESLDNNRCLISETFYKLVDKVITAKVHGKVELKGKSQPMKVYYLS